MIVSEKRIVDFWSKVDRSSNCWTWLGYTDGKGYGGFYLNKKMQRAHRVSLFLKTGEWVPYILHSCDNPACVNPQHLKGGTHKENMREMVERKRTPQTRMTHCKRGHELSEGNIYRYGNTRMCKKCAIQRAVRNEAKRRARNNFNSNAY